MLQGQNLAHPIDKRTSLSPINRTRNMETDTSTNQLQVCPSTCDVVNDRESVNTGSGLRQTPTLLTS